jgi:hypothetical protein
LETVEEHHKRVTLEQIAEKLDFEFDFWVAQRFTTAITGFNAGTATQY